MSYMSGIESRAPLWVQDILHRFREESGNVACSIWEPLTRGFKRSWEYAHYNPSSHRIEMAWSGGREQTLDRLWTTLHELAHAIDERQNARQAQKRLIKKERGIRRATAHTPEFWAIAMRLYEQFPGVMEHAVRREYMMGRKIIQRRLIELAYQKRRPSVAV